jgi:hypothetical protein
MADDSCPNRSRCEMFDVFMHAGTLAVWQINYCSADYSRCARYQRAAAGVRPPRELLPNGKMLPVVNQATRD